LTLRPRKDLVETLLHEMIHAYLFITDRNRDHDGHGPKFHYHMRRINAKAGTNITVRHNFVDEVKYYQRHWWRCNGICRSSPPFYGWVKRSMNRAPSGNDFWFEDHQKTCGGTFIKVKEPEVPPKSKMLLKTEDGKLPKGQTTLDSFPGKGYVLGGTSSPSSSTRTGKRCANGDSEIKVELGRSAELFIYGNISKIPKQIPTTKQKISNSSSDSRNGAERSGGVVLNVDVSENGFGFFVSHTAALPSAPSSSAADDDISVLVQCPSCNTYIQESTINAHLDCCLTQQS
uniref:Protein with SprT-like domain at the N terminus n=1 Tax=Gongylonema pulchrum TaxID=637853 RepID=A0A183D2L6_9BILA